MVRVRQRALQKSRTSGLLLFCLPWENLLGVLFWSMFWSFQDFELAGYENA